MVTVERQRGKRNGESPSETHNRCVSQNVGKAVGELVEPGSTVRTDGWKGYTNLKKKGYKHIVVAHTEVELGDNPTALVHRIASLLKRWLLGTHQGGQQFSHLHYSL